MNTTSSPLSSISSVADREPRQPQEKNNTGDSGAFQYDEPPSFSEELQSVGNDNIELQRMSTCRLYHETTMSSARNQASRESHVSHGAGIPYPPSNDPEKLIVEFDGLDDPLSPKNWTLRKRILLGTFLTLSAYIAAYASAVFPATAIGAQEEFGFGHEVAALGTTLFVLGFAAGPTFWGPGSELLGRRIPISIGLCGFSIFTVASATTKDTQSLMIIRFFSGFFAASPVSLVPASLSDLFDNVQRGAAIGMYTMAVFIGPFTSSFIGGFTTANLGWRFTLYIPSFFGFLFFVLHLIFGCETFAPKILSTRASELRRQTQNWGIHARHEEAEINIRDLLRNNLARPVRMLMTEPILFLLTLYMSFIYGLAYALLQAYPVVFSEVYGMAIGVNGLPFISLIIGLVSGTVFVLCLQRSYSQKVAANDNIAVPEWRLMPCMIGGVVFAGGIFWFGWTGYDGSMHWMVPTAAGIPIGFGMVTIFMQGWNYLLDSYREFAASAFAANMMLRSLVGASFPLFTTQMFGNMGVQWASTLLGCIAAVMIPIPIIFRIYGKTLREKSHQSRVS